MDGTKKILRGLLTCSPTALTMRQLSNEYRNTIGEPIPYQKFGYNSLEHFLRSIPDTLQVQGNGPLALIHPIVSEKSCHVMELVSKQKINRSKSRNGRMPIIKRHVVRHSSVVKKINPPPSRPQSQKIFYPQCMKPSVTETSNISISTNHSLDHRVLDNTINNKSENHEVEEVKKKFEGFRIAPKISHFQSVRRSYTLSSDNPDRILTPDESYTSLSKSSKSILNSGPINNNNETSHQIVNSHQILPNVDESSEERVPTSVKNNLKYLIGCYPDGIWCAEVPAIYRKLFKRELKYIDFGFRTLIDLCMSLTSIFHYVRPSTGDFKLYDKSKPLPPNAEKSFTLASYNSSTTRQHKDEVSSALPNIDWSDISSFLPPNVFKPGNEIPRTFVEKDTKEDDIFDVMIGEIYDISKFWIYKDDGKLDKLMDDIQSFYNEHANEYRLPQNLIREGVYCVAVIMGEYHRTLIVDIMPQNDESTRVFFIDYGTMAKVKSEFYFLLEPFAELPAQTIRCRLANICPPEKGAPWSHESSKEFRQLIKKRRLAAKISRIDWKEQYLEIFLADVTTNDDVFYINNVLVEKGYGVFSDQEQENSIKSALSTPIVTYIHLFPTFLELEHGLAPSTLEMEIFHKYDTPINFCFPQYFFTDIEEEKNIIENQTKFYEENILNGLRRDLHHNLNLDMLKIKNNSIDFSSFGSMEEEIRSFSEENNYFEEEDETTESLTSEATYDSQNIGLSNSQRVCDLQNDCLLSGDIMNEILNIAELNKTEKINQSLDDELILEKTDEDEESERSYPVHPLQCLQFSNSNSLESLEDADSECYSSSLLSLNTFEQDNESLDNKEDCENTEAVEKADDVIKTFNSNNPFLNYLVSGSEENTSDIVSNNGRLLSTNPFLSCWEPKDDNLDKNSDLKNSTYNDSHRQMGQIEQRWSTADNSGFDMSISQYSETTNFTKNSARSASSHESVLTSSVVNNLQVAKSSIQKHSFNASVPEFYPQDCYSCSLPYDYPSQYYQEPYPQFHQQTYAAPYQQPYTQQPYPQHPPMYNSPYYNHAQQQFYVRQTNLMQQPQETVTTSKKPICSPPPGFGTNSNIFQPPLTISTQTKDFYDTYNKVLKQKFQ